MEDQDDNMTRRERLLFVVWLCLLVIIIALASCARPAPALPLPPRTAIVWGEYERLVEVRTSCDGVGKWIGSGVRVGGHVVLTAGHVVMCPDRATDGEPPKATVTVRRLGTPTDLPATIEGATAADIARLEVPDLPEMPEVTISKPRTGDELCGVVAFPLPGRVCGELWPSEHDGPANLRVRAVAEHGNSGGGVWNEAGELVGILDAYEQCRGVDEIQQVCTTGVTSLANQRWIAAPDAASDAKP